MPDITTWPWPKVISTNRKTFLISPFVNDTLMLSELFQSSDNYWGAIPALDLGLASETSEISIADFGPFYVVCTLGHDAFGQFIRRTYVRDLTNALGYGFESFVVQADPIIGTCCNFNGQFLGGNIQPDDDGIWASCGTHSVLWSDIGNYELDNRQTIVAGNIEALGQWPVNREVIVYKIMQLSSNVMIYTDAGIVVLGPGGSNQIFTYGHVRFPGVGIRSGNHVAGDDFLHGMVALNDEFWLLPGASNPERRGYKEFISRMRLEQDNLHVSYVADENTFFIGNGIECLVINKHGAFMTHQAISGAVQGHHDAIYGTSLDSDDTKARITTDSLNFGSIGISSIESLLANVSMPDETTLKLAVNWRAMSRGEFKSQTLRNTDPSGRAGIHVRARSFQLRAEFSHYADVELFDLLTNVKYNDQRYKRGTVPAQHDVGVS